MLLLNSEFNTNVIINFYKIIIYYLTEHNKHMFLSKNIKIVNLPSIVFTKFID